MLVGKACANLQEESHLYNPHACLSVKWLQSKTPQRIHLQRKWLQKHLYESYLHGLKQMEGNKLEEERRQGGVLSPRLMSSRISTSPCTTHFYNFIFTWGDGTGCAVHTGVFAVASVTAGPTTECVLCLPVLWNTFHPETGTTACLGLQKTDPSYYVHINIM